MKILLTMNLPWFPAVGGANKCNRALAEGLARGHAVRAVVPALAVPSRWTLEEVRDGLRARGIEVREEDGADVFWSEGVEVVSIADPARLRGALTEQLRGFAPDRVLVSSEDPSQNLLDAVLKAQAAPVIYLSHTPAFLPFGPQAFYPSERRTRMLGQAAGLVAVSRFVAGYIRRWGGLEAAVFPFPIYVPVPAATEATWCREAGLLIQSLPSPTLPPGEGEAGKFCSGRDQGNHKGCPYTKDRPRDRNRGKL